MKIRTAQPTDIPAMAGLLEQLFAALMAGGNMSADGKDGCGLDGAVVSVAVLVFG